MADIAILTHEQDRFEEREYLLGHLVRHWRKAGHRVAIAAGPDHLPKADLAILHVDLSVVPAAYLRALRRYPIVLNGQTGDIRKRRISRHLVRRNDPWEGPVVIKTDLNCGGWPEYRLSPGSRGPKGATGALPEARHRKLLYTIHGSSAEIPPSVWRDPALVVERFLPEQDARGYWLRVWVFFGGRERCTRYLASRPIVKGVNVLARESVPVPRELRAERARLGFDYGKFDFVVRGGEVVLFDANRTPAGTPPSPGLKTSNARLARGLDAWLKS